MKKRLLVLVMLVLTVLSLTACSTSDVTQRISSLFPHSEGYEESLQAVNDYADAVTNAKVKYRKIISNAEDAKNGKIKAIAYLKKQVADVKAFVISLAEIKELRASATTTVSTYSEGFTERETEKLNSISNSADEELHKLLTLKLDGYAEDEDTATDETSETEESEDEGGILGNKGKLIIIVIVIIAAVGIVIYLLCSKNCNASYRALPQQQRSVSPVQEPVTMNTTQYVRTRKYKEVERYCMANGYDVGQFIKQHGGVSEALNSIGSE